MISINFNDFKTDKPILHFKIRDLELANIYNAKFNRENETKKFSIFLKKKDLEKMSNEYERDERYKAEKRTVEDLTTKPEFIEYYNYEEGKKEESIETAKKLLAKNFSEKEKMEYTNFNKEDILKLTEDKIVLSYRNLKTSLI